MKVLVFRLNEIWAFFFLRKIQTISPLFSLFSPEESTEEPR